MGTRKIKRRKRTVRKPCDDLLYEDEDGEQSPLRAGQWVEFRRKQSTNDLAAMIRFAQLADAPADGVIEQLPALIEILARNVVAWNWVDLDGEYGEDGELPLLPEPIAEVLADLDFETDLLPLVEMWSEMVEPEKNSSVPS